jgi:tetratricopeptide (TPR) repeat protein
MCFEQGRYQDCCDHLDDALRVQPLVPASWYLKGIACMRIENYSGAMEAFTRCVQQDMEIGEAWGNLAAIHMHCKRFDRAYECLLEAQKYRSREWRLTENLLTVCIETGRYAESLQFMRQLLELRHHKSNAIQKQTVANNSSDVNTVDEHPTPVHIPDLRKLCVVVAIRTVKFVRALDAATASASIEKASPAVSGVDVDNGIVLPRLTTELEAFLSEILTVMHVDPIYYELLVMYHDLIYTGADVAEDGEEASLENGNLEDRQVAASNSTASPGAAELWARRRSKNAIREFRLKQFRVLLNRPVWERDEKLVKELFRVIQIVIDCYVEDAGLLSKKDFYGLRSMLKTALSRLETFYQDSRQLEGAAAGEKVSDLNQLHSFISICTEYEEGSVN